MSFSIMTRDKELKKYILENKCLGEDKLAQAEDYALTMGLPLEESIIFLQLMELTDLGRILEAIYHTPYRPILHHAPTEEMKRIIPLSVAEKFNVFPVAYDPAERCLTLAIDDPADQDKREKISHLLAPSTSVEFAIASQPEINRAIDIHYRGKTYAQQIQVELPEEFTIVTHRPTQAGQNRSPQAKKKAVVVEPDLERFRALKTMLRLEGVETLGWAQNPDDLGNDTGVEQADLVLINAETYRPQQSTSFTNQPEGLSCPICYYYPRAMLLDQCPPYRAMGEALVSLVSFLVKKALEKAPAKLKHTLSLVRYCKLVSLRLGLSPSRIDAVVLAAWLSTSNFGSTLAKNIDTPYKLDQILDEARGKSHDMRIETQVLSLVKEYLSMKETNPEAVRDTEGVRKTIGPQYKKGQKRIVFETFVQVIRDEGLLEGMQGDGGAILLVGKSIGSDAELALRLKSDGYKVHSHPSPTRAEEIIFTHRPDIVLCDISPDDRTTIELCRTVRENQETSDLPFFFVATEEDGDLATECLAMGADDFITRPIDPDLLILKIRRTLRARASRKPAKGIEGSLTEMNAMEIIQSVATGDKNVKITLESNGTRGSIFIKGGEIVHAEAGSLVGEKALFELMAFQDGQFRVVSWDSFPQRTIHASTMSLLMEGARLADEANATAEVQDI